MPPSAHRVLHLLVFSTNHTMILMRTTKKMVIANQARHQTSYADASSMSSSGVLASCGVVAALVVVRLYCWDNLDLIDHNCTIRKWVSYHLALIFHFSIELAARFLSCLMYNWTHYCRQLHCCHFYQLLLRTRQVVLLSPSVVFLQRLKGVASRHFDVFVTVYRLP